jgi:hypothetical protein
VSFFICAIYERSCIYIHEHDGNFYTSICALFMFMQKSLDLTLLLPRNRPSELPISKLYERQIFSIHTHVATSLSNT